MAEGLTARGIHVTQVETLPEVLPTVEPELGALVHAELEATGSTFKQHDRHAHPRIEGGRPRLSVEAVEADGEVLRSDVDVVLVVVGVRPDTELRVEAARRPGAKGAVAVDERWPRTCLTSGRPGTAS